MAPEDPVTVVRKAAAATKDPRQSPKAKGQGQSKARPKPAAAPLPQAAAPPPPPPAAQTAKKQRRPKQAAGQQRLSCLDAAVKVLTESRQPVSCPELIAAMAAKGYWTSRAGKTPAATLYAALLRELRTTQAQARFRKTGPGRFARA